MARIKLLNEDIINQISAGEVVERPASAIKELVENSIDASSTSIIIKTKDAGKKLIEIIDNGLGMTEKDITLSILPHATSKLEKAEDLFNITSLGFRGEALASISAISDLSIASKQEGDSLGTRIDFKYSKLIKIQKQSMTNGTKIRIENIFSNTPARLKFLKSDKTEQLYISNIVKHYAFLYPMISFEYYNNDKRLLKYTTASSRLERLNQIKNTKTDDWLLSSIELNYVSGEIFVLKPTANIRKKDIKLYVNGRNITDKILTSAIVNAYQELSITANEAVVYLVLNIEPHFVDLNVSPTKNEVRFLESGFVYDLVYKSVLSLSQTTEKTQINRSFINYSSRSLNANHKTSYNKSFSQISTKTKQTSFFNDNIKVPTRAIKESKSIQEEQLTINEPYIGQFYRIIGQFLGQYTLLEDGENLVLIDQHASHERINYERIKKEFLQGEKQKMLIPQIIELDGFTKEDIKAKLDILNIDYEILEEKTTIKLKIRALPNVLENIDISSLIQKYLNTDDKEEFYRIAATMSCHTSIRGTRALSDSEINILISQLLNCNYPYACPHGRPTIVKLHKKDIEKLFERI